MKIKRLLQALLTRLWAKVAYVSDRVYVLMPKPEHQGLAWHPSHCRFTPIANARPWVCIMGREHYFETTKTYPIASRTELAKVLTFASPDAPYDGVRVHDIQRTDAQSHSVTSFVFSPKSLSMLSSKPRFILPETWLLVAADSSALNVAKAFGKSLAFGNQRGRVLSALVGKNLQGLEQFAWGSGVDVSHQHTLDELDMQEILTRGLGYCSANQWLAAWRKPAAKDWRAMPWRQYSIALAGASALYLVLSSLLLLAMSAWYDWRLSAMDASLQEAMAARSAYRQHMQTYSATDDLYRGIAPTWQIWEAFIALREAGAHITAMTVNESQVDILGSAPVATDMLELLVKRDEYNEASFKQPVRTDRRTNREIFAIGMTLAAKQSGDDSSGASP